MSRIGKSARVGDGWNVRSLCALLTMWVALLSGHAALCQARQRGSRLGVPVGGKKNAHQPRRVIALALQGDPGCDYTTKVDIGGNMLNLIVDTGSSNLAVAAAQCSTCVSVPSPRYRNTRRSKGAIGVAYGTPETPTSWTGVITSDVIKFPVHAGDSTPDDAEELEVMAGPLTSGFRGTLAAITENVNFFNPVCPSSHGIWGMAFRKLASAKVPTLFEAVVEQGVPDGFAMQLCSTDDVFPTSPVIRTDSHADDVPRLADSDRRTGNLWLGGVDSSKLAEPFRYIPLTARDWYQVRLDSIRLGGREIPNLLPLSAPKAIVDSGTTDIILSNENYHALVSALYHSDLVKFSPRVPKRYAHDFWFKGNSLRLPSREFTLNPSAGLEVIVSGIVIPIDVANVVKVTPYSGNPEYVDIYWVGFSPGGPQGSGVGTILGETIFVGKVVFFDRAPRPDAPLGRIGFAEGRDCYGRISSKAIDFFAGEDVDGSGRTGTRSFRSTVASESKSLSAAAPMPFCGRFWTVATTLFSAAVARL